MGDIYVVVHAPPPPPPQPRFLVGQWPCLRDGPGGGVGGEISGTQAVTHLLDSAAPLHLPELTTGGPPRARFDGREGGGGLGGG